MVVGRLHFPTTEQSSKATLPGVGSFDNQGPCSLSAFAFAFAFAFAMLFATTSNVDGDAPHSQSDPDIGVVVALVETEVLGSTRPSRAID